jgi:membrane protease subunit HflC
MNNLLKIGGGLAALALVVAGSASFYTLEEGEQAVIVQFGRPVGAPVTDAGLHLKLPFVQEVRRFEKRILIWDGDPNQIPTKGREFIWVDTMARWRIADAKKFLESVATEGRRPLAPERHHRLGRARPGVGQRTRGAGAQRLVGGSQG